MLEVLVDRFLEPMQQEKFFPKERMAFLTTNIQAVVIQQKQFKGRIEVHTQTHKLFSAFNTNIVDNIIISLT